MNEIKNSPVFLLSTRRSGTTLLQRIINSHEKITLWGEHGGFLKPIAKSYTSFFDDPVMSNMRNSKKGYENLVGKMNEDDKPIFWHNSLNGQHLKKCYKQLVKSLFTKGIPDGIYWGFKEVRYGMDDQVLRMLTELFPKAKFVYLFRRPQDMVESAIGVWNKEALENNNTEKLTQLVNHYKSLWLKQNNYLDDFYSDKDDIKVKYVCYEELIKNRGITEQLVEFLEVDFDDDMLFPLNRKFDSGSNNPNIEYLKSITQQTSFKTENDLYHKLLSKC